MRNKKLRITCILFLLLISILTSITGVLAFVDLGWGDLISAGIGCAAGAYSSGAKCKAYVAPQSGDCSLCNSQFDFEECTEYRCRAIGANCQFRNEICRDGAVIDIEPPEITSCVLYDLSTMESRNINMITNSDGIPAGTAGVVSVYAQSERNLYTRGEALRRWSSVSGGQTGAGSVSASIKSCDLGNLVLDREYGFEILTNEPVEQCRFSIVPDKEDLFDIDFTEGGEESSADVFRRTFQGVFFSDNEGLIHIHPIDFNEEVWIPEMIEECNSGKCTFYARCVDDSGNRMREDFVFKYKVTDGVGDTDAPKIISFDPIDSAGRDYYTLPLSAGGNSNVEFDVWDSSGVESCRFSRNNVGFDQMENVNCRGLSDDESPFGPVGDQQYLKRCGLSLSGIIEGENKFYFMCRDLSENRNVNPRPYIYTVKGASGLSIEVKAPATDGIVDGVDDKLKVETSGGVNGEASCKYSYRLLLGSYARPFVSNLIFDSDREGAGTEDRKIHVQDLGFLNTNGNYNFLVECEDLHDSDNKASQNINIRFVKGVAPPEGAVPCSGNDNSACAACPGDAYCKGLGNEKFLCYPSRVKQSCVNGFCSNQNCPTISSTYDSSYCDSFATENCLAGMDNDNDGIVDAEDCNDFSDANACTNVADPLKCLGKCDVLKCQVCSVPNPTGSNNRGVCYVDTTSCTPAACTPDSTRPCSLLGTCTRHETCNTDGQWDGSCILDDASCIPELPTGCEITEVKWYNKETGQPYSNEAVLDEGTEVRLKVKGNEQCNNADVIIDLYDYEQVVGENVYEQISFMEFPRTLKLDQPSDSGRYYKVAFITLSFKEDANTGYRDSDPELVAAHGDIISATSQKKSQIIKVKPKITPPTARAGEDCKTTDSCNGKWGVNPADKTKLICVKTQQNCPNEQPPVNPALCDGKKLDAGESCDGNLLNGNICSDLGFSSGTLRCKNDCTGFDINSCRNPVLPEAGGSCTANVGGISCPGIVREGDNVCVDIGDNCPAGTTPPSSTIEDLKINSVSSNRGNIVVVTSKGVNDDGSSNCVAYNNIVINDANKVDDLISVDLGDKTIAHTYTHTDVGSYSGWYVKCIDNDRQSDFRTARIPDFTVTSGTGDRPLAIDSVSSDDGNIVVVTSGGKGDDGSAGCSVYTSISLSTKVDDLNQVEISPKTKAHTYTHTTPGNYNGWYVKCIDNENANDFKTRSVPRFTIIIPPGDIRIGSDCKIDNCDGKYNSKLICIKNDLSCPRQEIGEITVTITSPRPNEQFGTNDNILLQVTSSESADCKYVTFEMGVDSEPDYNTMINMIPTSASRKLIHTKQINYNGEKGYYFRCKNAGKEGFNVVKILNKDRDVTGAITVNIISPTSNAEFANGDAVSLRVRSSENAECRYTSYNLEDSGGGLPGFESMSLMNPLTSARTEHLANGAYAGKNIYYFKCKNTNKEGDNYVMVRTKTTPEQCPYNCIQNNICESRCSTDSKCPADPDCGPVCNADGDCDAGENIDNCNVDCSPCVSGTRRDCGISNIGLCALGKQICVNSVWGICSGNVDPMTEVCGDNSDNDCDSSVDEGCACIPNGATIGCGTDVGVCTRGTQSCVNGDWGICNGVNPQASEVCNNDLDDDCDGSVDEGCDLAQCNRHQSDDSCIENNCKWSGDNYKCDSVCASGWEDTDDNNECERVDPSQECRINQVRWVKLDGTSLSSVEERAEAYAIITGTNCEKDGSIGYKIYEEDKFLGLDLDAFDDELPGGTVSFIDDNVASLEWIATRIEDDMDPNNEYYIRIIDTKSNLLKVLAATPAVDGSADNDGDGLTNYEEEEIGTNPDDSDSDDDGFSDGEEVDAGTNPLDRNSRPGGTVGPSGTSSLILGEIGPSGTQQTINPMLFLNLREGPDGNGIATCYYRKGFTRELEERFDPNDYDGTMESERVFGGTTKYSKVLNNLRVGNYEYYIRCQDSSLALTQLRRVNFNIQIPESQQLSIWFSVPAIDRRLIESTVEFDGSRTEGLFNYGKRIIETFTATTGGVGDVNCVYTGIGSSRINTVKTVLGEGAYVHTANITVNADGIYNIKTECSDGAGQTAEQTFTINIVEDRIAPEIGQIVTVGNSKYITVSEEAECEISIGNSVPVNENQWRDVGRDARNRAKQLITVSGSYYFRCKDLWDNQMNVVKINP